jgi:phosphoribosylglycinamide formyltransferase-1
VVVLISGRGSNLQSLLDAVQSGELAVTLAAVISNEPDAAGLARAHQAGTPTDVVNHRDFPSRNSFDAALDACIQEHRPDLVVLAGFMRVLGNAFVNDHLGHMINIHPSLLPRLPGLDTHARAIAEGHAEHGASVHFVTPQLDGGPVIAQTRVPVLAEDDADSLARRVLEREHVLLPRVVGLLAQGRVRLRGDRVIVDGHPLRAPLSI